MTEATPDDYSGGIAAFVDLLRNIGNVSNDTCLMPDGSDADGRDYRRMTDMVRASVESILHQGSPGHREGWMQALAFMLCVNADGCGVGADELQSLTHTARPFTDAKESAHV